MRKEDVKYYLDPDGFENGCAAYPCNTQYMIYNPLLHRYFLTEEGLSHYGVDYSQYASGGADRLSELIKKTSKKVYDYIQYKSGRTCYQIMLYRIAAAPPTVYPDQYFMRKQFEEALADQARYLVENGDSARYSRANMDTDTGETMPVKPEDALRDTSDIAPETIRTLETLGLTRWFKTPQSIRLDPAKY